MAVLLAVLACKDPEVAALRDAALIRFAPDDTFALVVRRSEEKSALERFDLGARAVGWTAPLPSPIAGVSLVGASGRFAVVEPDASGARDRISVRAASDGRSAAQLERELDSMSPQALRVETRQRVAVGEDGRWLAIAAPSALDVYALPGGERVLHESRNDRWPASARFDATSSRLAVARRASDQPAHREVVVFARAGETWTEHAVLPGADEPAWTKAGLVVLRETGIDVWSDGSTRSAVTFAPRRPLAFAVEEGPRSAHFAPDGRFALIELESDLALVDLGSGQIVFERGLTGEGSRVEGAAFGGNRATVFLDVELEGILLQIDLATGKVAKECSWGRLGRFHRPLFYVGKDTPWEPAYWPTVSATGRFLAIEKPEAGHRLHRLD